MFVLTKSFVRLSILVFLGWIVLPLASLLAQSPPSVDSLNNAAFRLRKTNQVAALAYLQAAQNKFNDSVPVLTQARTYQLRAGLYRQQGFIKAALSDYYLASQLLRKGSDSLEWNKTQVQIASLLTQDNQRDTALVLYQSAKTYFADHQQNEELINVFNSLGGFFLDWSKLDSATHYLQKAKAASEQKHYAYGLKKALYQLGVLYQRKKDFSAASRAFAEAYRLDSLSNDLYGMAAIRVQEAEMALEQQLGKRACQLAEQAYGLARSIPAFEWMEKATAVLIQCSRMEKNPALTIAWQDTALRNAHLRREKEAEYSTAFLEIFRQQQRQAAAKETIFNRALRVSNEQLFIITVGTFILIILAVLVVMVFINYQKQKHLGRELRAKNILIEKQVAELEIDNATKSKLLSIISHDLRNPMVNTKGILNLVNQDMVPADTAKQLLRQLETQYMGTTSLLDNLLFWLRGQMNGKNMEYTRFSLHALLESMFVELASLVKQKNIQLHNTVDPHMLVWADQDMLRIILRNLVSNAVKFTPSGGTITLAAVNRSHDSLITVQDTGIGMGPETIEKVLARQYFTTVGTEREKGSGFGLMLCQDLIHRHKGKLMIDSQAGKGSIFSISLPLE
ncbi:MAG: sensor histidine kinase [Sphingobacteriia bacterium]|nr:MAG: sensor histidine kinase [Sphingobacteriia bacterium]